MILKLLQFDAELLGALICCWVLFELDDDAVGKFGRISILKGIEFVVVAVAAGAECSLLSFGGTSRLKLALPLLLVSSSEISL